MTWPPPPWVVIVAWLALCFCLLALWVIACVATDRYHRRRARARCAAPAAGDWLTEALADWPGPELDDEILARQIQVALTLSEGRS
jgi:hypothetical protein